jgi:hypothetical protein
LCQKLGFVEELELIRETFGAAAKTVCQQTPQALFEQLDMVLLACSLLLKLDNALLLAIKCGLLCLQGKLLLLQQRLQGVGIVGELCRKPFHGHRSIKQTAGVLAAVTGVK